MVDYNPHITGQYNYIIPYITLNNQGPFFIAHMLKETLIEFKPRPKNGLFCSALKEMSLAPLARMAVDKKKPTLTAYSTFEADKNPHFFREWLEHQILSLKGIPFSTRNHLSLSMSQLVATQIPRPSVT